MWAIFILVLSIIPGPNFPKQKLIPHLDKLVHFVFYAVLIVLAFNAWRNNSSKSAIFVIGVVLFYGFLIELIQHFLIDKRYFDIYDLVANTAGVLIGLRFNLYLIKKTNQFNIK